MAKYLLTYNKKYNCVQKCMLLLIASLAFLKSNAQKETTFSGDNGLQAEINELDKAKKLNAKEMAAFEIFTQNFIQAKMNAGKSLALPDTSCVATIPVVFHVFHPNGAPGVPLSQINYAVRDLNITFGGIDADYGTVNAAFAGVKSYTKIRFALAKIDPNGNATNGVVYYKDKQAGFGNGSGWDNEIASVAWDNYKYFNIYVMNDLYANNVTNNSGVCWYPNTGMSDARTARMVYNYTYLGQGGSSFNNLEFNQTLTHECGHYMNLLHTFDGNNCAGPGDLCNDTPPTNTAGGGCNATICSALINGENYMDYNATCYKNFTMDQNLRMEAALMHPSRITLWQYDNQVATGILNPQSTNTCVTANKFFSFSKTQLFEDIQNNGSINTPPVIIYACAGAQFASAAQTLVQGTDYTISNLPAGLSPSVVTSADGKTATLTLTGQAAFHGTINTTSSLNFAFTNAAVVGGNVSAITNYSTALKIRFYDPWGLTCVNPANLSASSSATWTSFQTNGPIPKNYGLKYNAGNLYLETYGRGIITTALNSDNIVFLPAGTLIGPASAWRTGGNAGLLYSASYNALDGTTGYVGIRMQVGADYYYGYMTIQVSSTGGATILEYIYNNKPNDPITAGTNCMNVGLRKNEVSQKPNIYPNPASDKIYISKVNASLIGSSYTIYAVDGKIIKSGTMDAENFEINISGFESGFYILELGSTHNKEAKTTVKIIKN